MLTNAQKLEEAARLKDEGNKFVSKQEYKQACRMYRRVFAYTNGLLSKGDQMAQYSGKDTLLSEAEAKTARDIKLATYLNLALCYLKLEMPEKALEVASQALTIDPKNVKALFRVGSAAIALKLWDRAERCLAEALKIDPNNIGIRNELKLLKEARQAWEKEQKSKEKAMFGGKLL